jgi:hypothetical protein
MLDRTFLLLLSLESLPAPASSVIYHYFLPKSSSREGKSDVNYTLSVLNTPLFLNSVA